MAEGPEFSTPDGLYYSSLGAVSPAEPTGEGFRGPLPRPGDRPGSARPGDQGLTGFDACNCEPGWGRWFRLVGARPTGGITVMSGPDNNPLLILSRVDKGRVGLLLSDQMWLWARGYDGGGPYLDLLRRTAHWLMKEPDLEEEALRASAKGREVTVERQSVSGKALGHLSRRSGRAEDQARPRALRAGPQPRACDGEPVRPLSRRGRRTCRAGQRRARESARNAGRRLDDREAARNRRSDGGHVKTHRGGSWRADLAAAGRRPEPVAGATAEATISGSSGPDRAN